VVGRTTLKFIIDEVVEVGERQQSIREERVVA
jgi:hypothetical protein